VVQATAPVTDQAPQCGSRVVLERLWTPEQLRGRPADTKITRLRPPDRTPPDPLPVGAEPIQSKAQAPSMAKSIRRVQPRDGQRLVALTFDLCERADQISGYDGAIVEILRQERVPATFFAGGKWMRTHPERTMQLMADPLFEVGSHAWTHGNLRVLEGEKADTQIAWAQQEYALLRDALRKRAVEAGVPDDELARIPAVPSVFRFPYGVCSKESLEAAGKLGLAAIQWDVISGDAVKGSKPEQLIRAVLANVKPGSIVVFHANGREFGTAQAVPAIVRDLRAKGYRLVTVSELLRSGEPVASDDCYERRPGDNRRYDSLFGEGTG
jgi:peptidoglycan-N-acetylglucosamine deacetylase